MEATWPCPTPGAAPPCSYYWLQHAFPALHRLRSLNALIGLPSGAYRLADCHLSEELKLKIDSTLILNLINRED